MGGGGQLVGQVAQVVLDLAEGLALGEIDQPLGHAAEGMLGVGPEAAEEFLDAGLAVIGGRGGVRGEHAHAGAHPGTEPTRRYQFPTGRPAYHGAPIFSPTFPEHTRIVCRHGFFLDPGSP